MAPHFLLKVEWSENVLVVTSSKTHCKGVSSPPLWGKGGQHPIWLISRGLSKVTPFKMVQYLWRALRAVALKDLWEKLTLVHENKLFPIKFKRAVVERPVSTSL